MHEDDELHEPEHDHLLDREFFDDDSTAEPEASSFDDDYDEDSEFAEDEDDAAGWLDQPDD
ncbi:hypothetical protein [Pseudomonas cremoricolorata]|uniref:hypothetical protein n=1 Tax=Pseudomonas cremoricolorata TaxID=157783 RepID=UPI00040EC03A|nr:hypothetical protein [Pseudomonas cremoricolorata]